VDRITIFGLTWPWSAAPDVLDGWERWGSSAPPELWSSCRVRWIPSAGPSVSVVVALLGDPGRLDARLDSFVSAVGSPPSPLTSSTMTYLQAALTLAGCGGRPVTQCQLTTRSPSGIIPRQATIARSDFFDRPMRSSVHDDAVSLIEDRGSDPALSAQAGGMLLDAWGGRIA